MIDFNSYYALVIQFFSDHISITIVLGIAISYSLYKKAEITLKFLAICFFFVVVFYMMSLLSSIKYSGK